MNIVVMGYIVRGPYGGLVWHHLQYVLGLKKLGHEVLFLEDSDDYPSCSSPLRSELIVDATYGLQFIQNVFNSFDLKSNWAYFDAHTNNWYGSSKEKVFAFCKRADVLLNISAVNPLRDWWGSIPNRILIDTDPVFTQIRHLTNATDNNRARHHTAYFSFGENIGKLNCTIPIDGYSWKPTKQPIYLDAWQICSAVDTKKWTTVMQWDSYKEQSYNGKVFGMKSLSFPSFANIPLMLPNEIFELAIGNYKLDKFILEEKGWRVINSMSPTKTPFSYQEYILASKGEWSVAKHGYVVSNSGWFSERSACYLASGKPVVAQDTGFTENVITGKGLFSFKTKEQCAEAIKEINCDYAFHCREAKKIAQDVFDSGTVLTELLKNI